MRRAAIVLALGALVGCGNTPTPTPTPTSVPAPTPPAVPAGAFDCDRARATGIVTVREPVVDEWIVVLKHGVWAQGVQTAGLDVRRFKRTPGFVVKIPRSSGPGINSIDETVANLAANPAVQYVAQNGRKHKSVATWGLDRIDQRDLPLDSEYRPDVIGEGVHAFIIDTGIGVDAAEFGDRVAEGFSAHPGGTLDREGHGTHVAGTVGSRSWGVAPGVTLHPVRVLDEYGSGSDADVIDGVDWVTEWCLDHPEVSCVANSSLGGGPSPAMEEAYCSSIAAGVTHVFAAGNESSPATSSSPARIWQGLTVGATWRDDTESYFSNYGPLVDLYAPGSGITSVMLGGGLTVMSGTSMAAPHVTGAAALYLERHPGATPAEVAEGLVTQATDDAVIHGRSDTTRRMTYVKERE